MAAPTNAYEFVLGCPWPIGWAYGLLLIVAILGWFAARRPARRPAVASVGPRPSGLGNWLAQRQGYAPRWLLLLPLAWLAWQFIASTQTVQPALSRPTVVHFAGCIVCFYLGFFSLNRGGNLGPFWAGLICALALVAAVGWEQHFGGLEASRRYFMLYVYPKMKEVPPEYLKKLSSPRIFGTLFYPNALAGLILLLLLPALVVISQARRLLSPGARWFLALTLGLGCLACLYWSGSKGGWLLMLLLGLLALLRLPFGKTLKIAVLGFVLVGGLAGFFWKYSSFFQKGATSVSARFDYWHAALQTAMTHPLLGTGPGTFALPYQDLKRPESEMARLAHNDYLEQASDSGWPGLVTYAGFIIGALLVSVPRPWALPGLSGGNFASAPDWLPCALWLGLLGWALQGLFEFGLYLPALAWPAFAFLGLLSGRQPEPTAP